ncbi:hypothetical protein Tco_1226482 [Tanacetum coccineum]
MVAKGCRVVTKEYLWVTRRVFGVQVAYKEVMEVVGWLLGDDKVVMEVVVIVESSDEEGLGKEDASKQGRRILDIDADEDITLVNVQNDADMFGVNDLDGDEVLVEPEFTVKDVNLSVDEVTLAQALVALKSAKVQEKANVVEKPSESITTTLTLTTTTAATTIIAVSTRPRAKGIIFHEQEQAPTSIVSSQQPSQVKVQDKGKGIMVEESVKMKKKDQSSLDEEFSFKLQAEEEEEERLAREKSQQVEEANIAWDDVQAKIDVDYQLAQRLQAQEQEESSDAEKATLFVQLLEKRRNHFVAKNSRRKEEQTTNKSSTKEYHVYLSEKHGRMETQRFEEQVI